MFFVERAGLIAHAMGHQRCGCLFGAMGADRKKRVSTKQPHENTCMDIIHEHRSCLQLHTSRPGKTARESAACDLDLTANPREPLPASEKNLLKATTRRLAVRPATVKKRTYQIRSRSQTLQDACSPNSAGRPNLCIMHCCATQD